MSGTACGRWARGLCGAAGLLMLAGGCQHTLFVDPNERTESVIKRYYDDDSAERLSELRKKTADEGMGFGYPTGAAMQ